MTIIVASRSKRCMLADTLITDEKCETRVCHVTKIIRCQDGSLAGAAGDSGPGMLFMKWAAEGRNGEFPPMDSGGTFEGILLTPQGDILCYWGPVPELILGDWHAIGAGGGYFAAAMEMKGATIEAAIKAAIAISPKCGGQVTRLNLDRKQKIRR